MPLQFLCFYACAAQSAEIFLCILTIFCSELLVVLLDIVEISMEIGLFVCLDKTACDIGAVVGNTLQICEDILEDISQLNCTLVVLETADMAVFELCAEVVHHFLKRLYLVGDARSLVM